ncbi:MAG TPA: TrkA family potassium uptake protein [Epulopiscium sp.]|nr:TrkA family potassium uptake protein [Candidatus Epulonipiscium sp.]
MLKNKQFVVIGLGRFGMSVATTLSESGYEVMAVDINEEVIQEISSVVTHAVQADITDVDTLNSLGIRNFDVAIVAIGRDIQSSIMVTLLLKEIGMKYVVAKASNDLHKKVLQKLGADRIISPEHDMGVRIAHSLISGSIVEHIQLSPEYSIVEMLCLPGWSGKTIGELDMRADFGINTIAIERDKKITITPGPDFLLREKDILVVVGANEKIQGLQ